MAKVRVRKIRHPGGSETFQVQDPITGEWTDLFIEQEVVPLISKIIIKELANGLNLKTRRC